MNRARKHELEKNELADRLATVIAPIRPALPMILAAIGLLVVVSLVWGLYSSGSKSQASKAWTEYYFNLAGGDAESYLDVAEDFPSSTMAGWARQAAGDSYLNKGVEALYRDRKEGEDNLEIAISTYEEIVATADSDELLSKALLGLAQAHESLGELDKANEYYERFQTTSQQPQLTGAVQQRLAFINSPSGKSFYDWFSKLDPKPDASIDLGDMSLPPQTPDINFSDPSDILESLGSESLGSDPLGSDLLGTGTDPSDSSDTSAADGSSNTSDASATEIDPENLPKLDLSAPAPAGETTNIDDLKLPPPDEDATGNQDDDS